MEGGGGGGGKRCALRVSDTESAFACAGLYLEARTGGFHVGGDASAIDSCLSWEAREWLGVWRDSRHFTRGINMSVSVSPCPARCNRDFPGFSTHDLYETPTRFSSRSRASAPGTPL